MEIRRIAVAEARPIRREVLRPGLPEIESVYPGDDAPTTMHLGAFVDGELVCVATFMIDPCPHEGADRDWRLRGMATLEEARNRGLGARLLAEGIDRVAASGGARVWCNGRVGARGFYARHGFRAIGEPFEARHSGWHYLFVREL